MVTGNAVQREVMCMMDQGDVHEHVHVYVLLYFYVSETS